MQIHHNTVVYLTYNFHPKGESTALTDKILHPQNNRQRDNQARLCVQIMSWEIRCVVIVIRFPNTL
jgi:hypothetical protein